jgi:hypothetical protein
VLGLVGEPEINGLLLDLVKALGIGFRVTA